MFHMVFSALATWPFLVSFVRCHSCNAALCFFFFFLFTILQRHPQSPHQIFQCVFRSTKYCHLEKTVVDLDREARCTYHIRSTYEVHMRCKEKAQTRVPLFLHNLHLLSRLRRDTHSIKCRCPSTHSLPILPRVDIKTDRDRDRKLHLHLHLHDHMVWSASET